MSRKGWLRSRPLSRNWMEFRNARIIVDYAGVFSLGGYTRAWTYMQLAVKNWCRMPWTGRWLGLANRVRIRRIRCERPLRFCRSTGGPDIRENCEWPSVIRPQYPGRAKPYDRTGREYARSVWLYVFSLSFRGANVRPDAVGGPTDRKERFCPVTDHSAPVCQPPPNAL